MCIAFPAFVITPGIQQCMQKPSLEFLKLLESGAKTCYIQYYMHACKWIRGIARWSCILYTTLHVCWDGMNSHHYSNVMGSLQYRWQLLKSGLINNLRGSKTQKRFWGACPQTLKKLVLLHFVLTEPFCFLATPQVSTWRPKPSLPLCTLNK